MPSASEAVDSEDEEPMGFADGDEEGDESPVQPAIRHVKVGWGEEMGADEMDELYRSSVNFGEDEEEEEEEDGAGFQQGTTETARGSSPLSHSWPRANFNRGVSVYGGFGDADKEPEATPSPFDRSARPGSVYSGFGVGADEEAQPLMKRRSLDGGRASANALSAPGTPTRATHVSVAVSDEGTTARLYSADADEVDVDSGRASPEERELLSVPGGAGGAEDTISMTSIEQAYAAAVDLNGVLEPDLDPDAVSLVSQTSFTAADGADDGVDQLEASYSRKHKAAVKDKTVFVGDITWGEYESGADAAGQYDEPMMWDEYEATELTVPEIDFSSVDLNAANSGSGSPPPDLNAKTLIEDEGVQISIADFLQNAKVHVGGFGYADYKPDPIDLEQYPLANFVPRQLEGIMEEEEPEESDMAVSMASLPDAEAERLGWLRLFVAKRGKGLHRKPKWQDKWCMLKNGQLKLLESPNLSVSPEKVKTLEMAVVESIAEDESGDNPDMFVMESALQTYFLQTRSADAATEWIADLLLAKRLSIHRLTQLRDNSDPATAAGFSA